MQDPLTRKADADVMTFSQILLHSRRCCQRYISMMGSRAKGNRSAAWLSGELSYHIERKKEIPNKRVKLRTSLATAVGCNSPIRIIYNTVAAA